MTTPSQPLVSIVVPAYNHARYLREAIDGILAQDYPHIELIVLNDGSTDDTDEVLRSYPSGRFYWETQANMGQSATLNKGWRMSRGEILAYLSADDALRPEAVSRSVAELHARPEAVATYCDYELISAESTVLRRVAAPDFDYFAMLERGVCAPGPGAFFRRTAFEAAGPWNAAYRQMPDYDFWLRMGLYGTLRRIAEPLAYFRVHEQSQTFAAATVARSEEAIQIIADLYRRSDLSPEVRAAERGAESGAMLIAAQYHLRAGRYSAGIRFLAAAMRIDPGKICKPGTTRAVGSARSSGDCAILWKFIGDGEGRLLDTSTSDDDRPPDVGKHKSSACFAERSAAWFGAFLVAVCYGNVYVGVTLPAALFLLPFIAWRCPPPVSPPTVTWLMVACGVTPIAQWMLGHGPTTRSDFIEYFPIFYTALVAWGLGGLVIDAEDVVTPLLGGAALIAVLMVGHMIMYPPRIFAFYLVKATAATPLGRSNYLAVFFLIALNVALYANAPWARRAVVPLCLAIGLSLARIGSGFAVLSLLMWLRFVGVERRSTGLVVSGFAACAIPILVVGGLSAQPPSLERGDSLADIAAYHDQESIASLESISVRGELWSDAVDAFLAYPLFGVPKSVWSKVGEQVVVGGAHSSILTSLSGRGLWGTFVFGCFVVTMLRVVGCRRSKSPTWRGLSIALVMTLIWSLIEPILFTPAYACLTTALVSVTAFSGKHAVELRLAGTCARVAA